MSICQATFIHRDAIPRSPCFIASRPKCTSSSTIAGPTLQKPTKNLPFGTLVLVGSCITEWQQYSQIVMQPCGIFEQTAIKLRIRLPYVRLPIHLPSNLILIVRLFAFGTARFMLKLALGQRNHMKNRFSLFGGISLRTQQSGHYHELKANQKMQPSCRWVEHTLQSQSRQPADL